MHLLTLVYGEFSCPRNNQSQPIDGAYRDPENCKIYYHCINGISSTQSCPPGYHFQIKVDNCEFFGCVPQEFSNCEMESFQSYKTLISPQRENLLSGKNDVVECKPNKNMTISDLNDCRLYYHCYNGVGWPQRCPNGYYFSPKVNLKECVHRFCVPIQEADCPIHGQWSNWSRWLNCAGNCGEIGKRQRTRKCNHPPPMNNGKLYKGDSSQTQLCQVNECGNSTSFSVSLRYDQVMNDGKVNWTKINANSSNFFQADTQSLNIKSSEFYFFCLSGTVRSNNQFAFLHRSGYSSGIDIKSSNLIERTISRQYGMLMSSLYKPHILQEQKSDVVLVGSETGKETSWSGFLYNTDTYLYAMYETPIDSNGEISCNKCQMNGFVRNSPNQFTNNNSGVFYVSIGVGLQPFSITEVYMQRYNVRHQKIVSINDMNSTYY